MIRSLSLPMLIVLTAWPLVSAAQNQSVSGRVYDAVTGAPLARAALTLSPERETNQPRFGAHRDPEGFVPPVFPAATSGPDGSFSFAAVPPGRYRLTADRRGYLASALDQHGSFSAAVVVAPGVAANAVRFAMDPEATIEGRVEDSSGDPVDGGTITLLRAAEDKGGEIRSFRSQHIHSENNGSYYRFSDLPPGTYYLAAASIPWFAESSYFDTTSNSRPLDVAYPLTYYDGATTADNAQPIPVAAGADVHANLTLQAVPAVHITVTRIASGVFLFPRLAATAFGADLNVVYTAAANVKPDGTVQGAMAVAPGTYTVLAAGGRRTLSLDASETLASTDLFPTPPQPVMVTGELGMASGSAVPAGTQLTLMPFSQDSSSRGQFEGAFGRLRAPMEDDGPGSPFFHRRPVDIASGADGRFQATVPPGEYTLQATLRDGKPLLVTAAAATGAGVSPTLRLTVETGPVLLAATLAVADSSLGGKVAAPDGVAEAGVMVLLVPADPNAAVLYRRAESATDGSWQIAGLPAGAYRVVAIHHGWNLGWQNPESIAPFLEGAAAVTLQAAQEMTLSHPLIESFGKQETALR